jgi:hypothetical protein
MFRHLAFALFLSTVPLAAGCGGGVGDDVTPPDYGSEDGKAIAELVSRIDDARGDPAKFKKLFAGAAPANPKEYDKYLYAVEVGSPKVTGADATASVGVHKESDYAVVGTKEWAFTKVGDQWKIKSAPLPGK